HAPPSSSAPATHIGKFESRDPNAGIRDSFSDRFHERRIHRASRAVRENQGNRRGLRSVEQKLGHAYLRIQNRCTNFREVLREGGLEPPRLAAPDPKADAYDCPML